MMTREQAQAVRLAEEEKARRDWHDALQNEAAFRVFLRLLEGMGANRLMMSRKTVLKKGSPSPAPPPFQRLLSGGQYDG